ncbi:hypothetical protein E2C01_046819 [Portunus trituberculatus]|uniref:Uncharacterized protein n=1 Tax=Portunus trituberculatus TaxID=210409 RepID=A0A5B7G5V0_PORTR|nr:hypothetical protein [Portunus trituberculatus]
MVLFSEVFARSPVLQQQGGGVESGQLSQYKGSSVSCAAVPLSDVSAARTWSSVTKLPGVTGGEGVMAASTLGSIGKKESVS